MDLVVQFGVAFESNLPVLKQLNHSIRNLRKNNEIKRKLSCVQRKSFGRNLIFNARNFLVRAKREKQIN